MQKKEDRSSLSGGPAFSSLRQQRWAFVSGQPDANPGFVPLEGIPSKLSLGACCFFPEKIEVVL